MILDDDVEDVADFGLVAARADPVEAFGVRCRVFL